MKQHHPLLRRMLCAALALAVACMGTPALAKSIPALDPEMTVNSSHAIYYGSEASLADGVYGAQENVDGGGWVYVQTAADGTDNHVVFTVDLHETRTVYASGIGTIVNGWAEKMENLTLSASENGTDYTPLAAFDNAELAAEWGHRHEWACPEGAPVTARYLRYEFDIATSQITDGAVHYVCVDEIDVRTEADTPEPPPVVDPDPGDCVNLAAGRPYTSAWAASGSYADDGGQLTDGVYSRALSCKAPEWVGYYNEVQDGFEFIVDLGESKRFEQVKMNFLREEGSGIPTPYSVRIELSDDSASWRTLTQTDVAPIIEGSGIKRFVYTVPQEKRPEAQARYVKLHINFQIWLFIDEIEIFDRETPDQGTDVPPDDLPSVDLADGLALECPRELLYGAPATILTDSVTAGPTWNDSDWLSFNGTNPAAPDANRTAMVYDLGGKKSVSEIRLRALYDTANGVFLPRGLKLEVSDNKAKWVTLKSFGPAPFSVTDPGVGEYVWNGSTDAFISTTENADMVYFQYLRISFDCSGVWTAFDELTVMGKNGKCTTAGTLVGTPDGPQNLALDKPYTVSHAAPDAYGDTDGKELTDASFGSTDMYDAAWQGHSGEWPLRTAVVDLGQICAVEQVSMNFLQKSGSGICLPSRFSVYVSSDGLTWAALYDEKTSAAADGVHTLQWLGGAGQPGSKTDAARVAARYVRVDAELNGWLFFDELEVLGQTQAGDAVTLPQDADFEGAFLLSGPQTGGIRDMVLMYNGPYKDYGGNPGYGNWSKADCKPYAAYVDESGRAQDVMFDSALFLAQSSPETGHLFIESSDYGATPSNLADWQNYISKTIDRGGDMDALDAAVAETAAELGRPGLKMKVTVMVPFPDALCTDFGMLDGAALNLSGEADAQKALNWYLAEALRRFEAADYKNLEFAGFYWMHETNYRSSLIRYASEKAQTLGYPMLWIPFYNASGWNRGGDMGLSAVALQPNHFFPSGGPSQDRIRDAAALAKMYGLGMELEMDDRVFNDLDKYNKYLDYLNGGVKYGFIGPNSRVYRNWYNGIKTLLEASTGVNPYTGKADPVARALYDFTYQAIRGTYSPQPYRTSLEPDVSSDDSSGAPASSSASSGISSSGALSSGGSSSPGAAPDSGTSSSGGNGPSAVNVPQTGDYAPLFLLSLAAILCAGMLILLLHLKRRAPNEKK